MRIISYGMPSIMLCALLVLALTHIHQHQASQPTAYGTRGMPVVAEAQDALQPLYSERWLAQPKPGHGSPGTQAAGPATGFATDLFATADSCAQREVDSCSRLGQLYESHWDVEAFRAEAERWYMHGCRMGSEAACTSLRTLVARYEASTDGQPHAGELLAAVCAAGDPESCGLVCDRALSAAVSGEFVEQKLRAAQALVQKLCDGPSTMQKVCSSRLDGLEQALAHADHGLSRSARASLLTAMRELRARTRPQSPTVQAATRVNR